MHELMLWCAFLGAWLLFAGPVYQAALELQSEEFEFDRLRELSSHVVAPPPVSAWWWLLPPVRFVLQRRRSNRYQQLVIDSMPDEDFEAATSFISKATGWLYVGLGGFLIATTETYALVHEQDWSIVLFWVLLVVMSAGGVGNAVGRLSHSERERRRRLAAAQ